VSRPQPNCTVIGIWNRPALARGPKVISAIRQPAATMISGAWLRPGATLDTTLMGFGSPGNWLGFRCTIAPPRAGQ